MTKNIIMQACSISYMKFLFGFTQLEATVVAYVKRISVKQNALCELCGTSCCYVHYFN